MTRTTTTRLVLPYRLNRPPIAGAFFMGSALSLPARFVKMPSIFRALGGIYLAVIRKTRQVTGTIPG